MSLKKKGTPEKIQIVKHPDLDNWMEVIRKVSHIELEDKIKHKNTKKKTS